MTQETKNCQNCKQQFTIEPEDFDFYKKIEVPPPTWCPECRLQRRLAWRNERGLYKRKCDKCGKSMISVFAADSKLTVYCRPCWWSDDWDGLDYGTDFDPSKPFFIQLRQLLEKTPVMSLFGVYHTLENSDYVNMASYLKNCYMLFHSDESENCLYGSMNSGSKDCVDNLMINNCELCYENVNCQKCYRTNFSLDCEGCTDVWFSKNCVGCSNCFGCVNLRNQNYHIFNQPYSKEEYENKIREFGLNAHDNVSKIKNQVHEAWQKFPQKFIHERHGSNVSGDYIYNCKNTKNSFVANDMEDSRYCSLVTPGKTTNVYDFTHYGIAADLMYETLQCGNQSSRIRFSWFALTNSHNVDYSIFAIGDQDCFGTVSLKKRKFCILNKQYSEEEYKKLRQEIIEQMNSVPYIDKNGASYRFGEFFPIELSPFGYNVTTAQESFPLNVSEVEKKGYLYKEPEKYEYQITKTFNDLPDTIEEVPDSVTEEVLGCAHEGKCQGQCPGAYRITATELEFYRRLRIPLPRLCPNCRFDERLLMRNPFRTWSRKCMCEGVGSKKYTNTVQHFHGNDSCPNQFETSHAPDRPEIIYCEQCYNAEVV
ncbi:MAG: hypothetical protein AAB691_02700 [Patescibacteria group bacterium]